MEILSDLDDWIKASLEIISKFCTATELAGLDARLKSHCPKEFSRGISELVVSRHYAQYHPNEILIPRGAKKEKDIDVSFVTHGQRINIEVKCPDLSYEKTKTFTLHVPYKYPDLQQGKNKERMIAELMGGDLDISPNKVLNLYDFLKDCQLKFLASSESGDLNVVFFSMLEPSWLDDYRIKLEDEDALSGFDLIHAVVISNAALVHSRDAGSHALGMESCFSYIVANKSVSGFLETEKLRILDSAIPNETHQVNRWHRRFCEGADSIGAVLSHINKIKIYCALNLP